jgi:predicted Zn-dependent protease
VALLAEARERHPSSRPLLYEHVAALQVVGRHKQASAALDEVVRLDARDLKLRALQAKVYAALGKRSLHHQAQAEVYAIQGSVPAAIEQLLLARAAGDGDFYQMSMLDARLKELRAQYAEESRERDKR